MDGDAVEPVGGSFGVEADGCDGYVEFCDGGGEGDEGVEDDGVDFHERMGEIHDELLKLQEESNRLMETISQNMKEMGI